PNGRVKLLDFGLAWAAGDERLTKLTRDGGLVGTPSYMAPEQFGRSFGPRADLFSLGCILYEMTTGRRAFDGEHVLAILAQIANATPPAPHTLQANLPAALSDLIVSLLAKTPDDRPPTAEAVAERLRSLDASPERLVPRTGLSSYGMKFVLVPKGVFRMGGGGGTPGEREVNITGDFQLGVYQVTQGQ